MKTFVISYLRFSTPEQLKGDSQRRQLALSQEWAEKHHLKIDESIKDLGVSAYRSDHAKTGSLSNFLKLVNDGKIPTGSILLIESLDRLSRDELIAALSQFLGIIQAGIKIVTLSDGFEYTKENLNLQNLMYSLMIMSRANNESAEKSRRNCQSWCNKRANASNKPMTKVIPWWLSMENGKIVPVKERVKTIQRIYQLVLDGMGKDSITKLLNREKVPACRLKASWHGCYVLKILHSRAVLGECQPHKIVNGKRVPVDAPIPNYFPRIIADKTFYAVQSIMKKRTVFVKSGRNSQFVNLFTGLLFDLDGNSIVINSKGHGRRYVSSSALEGTGAKYVGFPVSAFETAILLRVAEKQLFNSPKDDSTQFQISNLEGKIAETDKQIEQVQSQLLNGTASPSVVSLLNKLDGIKATLLAEKEMVKSKQALSTFTGGTMAEIFRLIKSTPTNNAERMRVREAMGHLIRRIDCHFTHCGRCNYVCSTRITRANGQSFEWAFRADMVETMKRDKLGHPVKGGTIGTPTYNIAMLIKPPETETAAA